MHKIVVCGKGGAGKSSIVALLAAALRARGKRVLVVDADESNPGLYRLLGLASRPEPLMNLLGGKRSIAKSYRGEVAPANDTLLHERVALADLPAEYRSQADGVTLVAIGKILQSNEGCACAMGTLSREFLRRLTLAEDEVALVDTEAGIEHFGRGIEQGVDGVLVVVEPSYDAIELAGQIQGMAVEMGLPGALAVLNKAPDAATAAILRAELAARGLAVAGEIAYDPAVAAAGLSGRPVGDGAAGCAAAAVAERLL